MKVVLFLCCFYGSIYGSEMQSLKNLKELEVSLNETLSLMEKEISEENLTQVLEEGIVFEEASVPTKSDQVFLLKVKEKTP